MKGGEVKISVEKKRYLSDLFFTKIKEESVFASDDFKRFKQSFDDTCSLLVDIHLKHNIKIHYLRVPLESSTIQKSFFSKGAVNRVLESNEVGILLRVKHEERLYTVWLPSACGLFFFDKNQRLTISNESSISYQWEFKPRIQLTLLLCGGVGEVAIIPYVIMEDSGVQFFEELSVLNDIERRLYRKTDWFFAKTPSYIWNYLINGSIYDPRFEKGIDKRFKCQQCGYAWWSYFGFLYKETGKKIYDIMQNEIAYSVLMDLSAEGEWGHGFNSDDIETHTRFHIDGIHMLISEYEKTGESIWLGAAKRGMEFVFKHLVEKLDDGSIWFLHDTIEQRKIHHFKSTLFGKSTGNALIINTHVQTLTVLYRLRLLVTDNKLYSEMCENGVKALRRVLECQPGNTIYRLLMFLIMKYKTRMPSQSITGKLKNALTGLIIPEIYWFVRRKYPRFVYPGGFIERDLTRSFFSDRYHIINLKDLLTLYQQEPTPWLQSYIKNGVSFIHKFLTEISLEKALALSPYYIELIDVLYMYDRLFEHVDPEKMKTTEKIIYQQTGGYSLDYYVSELVHGQDFFKKYPLIYRN